jgi:hypothetical protein
LSISRRRSVLSKRSIRASGLAETDWYLLTPGSVKKSIKTQMKTTKTILRMLTVTSLALAFAGCGKKADEQIPPTQTSAGPTAAQSPPPLATSPVYVAKAPEETRLPAFDKNGSPIENDSFVFPDSSPTVGNELTLEDVNNWILAGDLSPTNTYYYIQNVDEPTNSEKPLASINRIVKILNPTSVDFSPSDVIIDVLIRHLAPEYVVVAQLKNSGDTTNENENSLLWRFIIPNPDNLMITQLPSMQAHGYLDQKIEVLAINGNSLTTNDSLIALNLMNGNVVWTKQFPIDIHNGGLCFNFAESNYVIAQNQSLIRGLDITKGTELWSIKWNEGQWDGTNPYSPDTRNEFIGVLDNVGYLFNDNPPAISSLNLKSGSTTNVIFLPSNSRMFHDGETKDKDSGIYQCLLLQRSGKSPLIVLDDYNTGLQLYSLPEGKLLWKKTHQEICPLIYKAEFNDDEKAFPLRCEAQGSNVLVCWGDVFKTVLSSDIGKTISASMRVTMGADNLDDPDRVNKWEEIPY